MSQLTNLINSEFKNSNGVIWGGGRLLGTLLDFGLDINNFKYVIDDHLYIKLEALEISNYFHLKY